MKPSVLCIPLGGYYADWFLMDVYKIVDNDSFADSVERIISAESTEMTTGGASHQAMSLAITCCMYLVYSLL